MTRLSDSLFRALPIVAILGIALAGFSLYWKGGSSWSGELHDPDVRSLYLDCGNENDPAGTGMPAWPEQNKRFYTSQHWTDNGELKVEVWKFLEPGNVLVSVKRQVNVDKIVVEPRWEVPPNGAVAACYAKFGVEVTFRNLPRRNYLVEPG